MREGAWLGRFGRNTEVKECDILTRSVTWPKIPFLRTSNLKIFVNNIDFDTFGSIKRVLLGLRSDFPFYVVRTFFSVQNLERQGCCLTNVSRSPEVQKPRSWSPTGNIWGAAAKHLGAQSTFSGALGCWAPVRRQPWTCINRKLKEHHESSFSVVLRQLRTSLVSTASTGSR